MVAVLLAVGATQGGAAAARAIAAPTVAAAPDLESLLDSVVDSLHEGDYALTRRLLEKAYQKAPADPGVLFLQAYALAWQGANNIRSLTADPGFMYLLDAIEANGERRLAEGVEEGRTSYYLGMAALMRARTRFSGERRELLRASSDARRGMRQLERAIELGYEVADASFWSGAYKAMAAALPAPLRALRVLIGLPGGSRADAVAELRRAAEHGRRFRVEATLFLAGALTENDEPDFAQAVELVRLALPEIRRRGSLLPLFGAELLAEWGLTPQAAGLWQEILDRRGREPGLYALPELARARSDLAAAMAQEVSWSEALPHLTALLERPDFGSPRLRQRATLLLARCHASLGERGPVEVILKEFVGSDRIRRQIQDLLDSALPDPQAEAELSEALRDWRARGASTARPRLEEFLRRHPSHLSGLLHAGRAEFELGLDADSRQHLERVLASGGASTDLQGWAHLYLGWLADRAGQRAEAREHYRDVERRKDFAAWRGGALYAQVPYIRFPCRETNVWAILRPERDEGSERAAGQP